MRASIAAAIAALVLAVPACSTPGKGPRPDGSPSRRAGAGSEGPEVVKIASASPLVQIEIMVRAGSTSDPPGKEGLAALVAGALIEGGFGDLDAPTTKEKLAAIVQPWGERAMPSAQVAPDTTTFHMAVPDEVLPEFLAGVLLPMLALPHFLDAEIDRLKDEMAAAIPSIRHESIEELGLGAIEGLVLEGTAYEHRPSGAEDSIPRLRRDDVVAFYRAHYRPENIILGLSKDDSRIIGAVKAVIEALPAGDGTEPPEPVRRPAPSPGRRAVVVEEPTAPAASVHLGFPIDVDRGHPDYWPLYVANVWLGTHRDSSGRLYQAIREERGYNYGDYSYIEAWDGRPGSLFPVFGQPRRTQYFSIWLRPVGHEHALHLMKGATWELERLVREGLTAGQVEAAKTKARVLYLNLAETVDRILGDAVDSRFLGLPRPWLSDYLAAIDRVTPEAVNGAIRKHLRPADARYLVITDSVNAKALAEAIGADRPAWGKGPKEYGFEEAKLPDGKAAWQVPAEKIETLRQDALWANHPLGIGDVRVVPSWAILKTGRWDGRP